MVKVLIIEAYPHVGESISISVVDYFIKKYREFNPADEVVIHDLYAEKVPALNESVGASAKWWIIINRGTKDARNS